MCPRRPERNAFGVVAGRFELLLPYAGLYGSVVALSSLLDYAQTRLEAAVVERYLSDLTERCVWEPAGGWDVDADHPGIGHRRDEYGQPRVDMCRTITAVP